MKNRIFLFAALLFLSTYSISQASSYQYAAAILDRINEVNTSMNETYRDTFLLRRVETGILSNESNTAYGNIKRRLFKGYKYSIYAITDNRVRNFRLKVYIKDASDNYQLLATEDDNSASNTNNLLGDHEIVSIIPDSSAYYKFEISGYVQNNITSRYGIMLWSRDVSTTPPPISKTYFSIDEKTECSYNTQTQSFDNCTDVADASSLFELNANHTVFKHTTSTITSNYYVQGERTYDSDKHWYKYKVISDAGNSYFFYVPDDNYEYFTILKDDGDNSYIVKHHIRRKWSE